MNSPSLRAAIKRWSIVLVLPVICATGFTLYGMSYGTPVMTYHIGRVDERFGLDSEEVSRAVGEAASIWERAAGRSLFKADPEGSIEIRLVYDYRQAVSDTVRDMSMRMSDKREAYDALKAHVDRVESEYAARRGALMDEMALYRSRIQAYNEALQNASGSIRLTDVRQEYEALQAVYRSLEQKSKELSSTADTLRDMVAVLNEMAAGLNLEIKNMRSAGMALGEEFSEGCYELHKDGSVVITVYHFKDHNRLVRVLAHEMGHALGLEHSSSPDGIMYRMNLSEGLAPSPEEVAGLRTILDRP
jgi:hypothetical protein